MHLTMAKKQQDNPDDSRLESDEDLDDVVDLVIGAEENSKEITGQFKDGFLHLKTRDYLCP